MLRAKQCCKMHLLERASSWRGDEISCSWGHGVLTRCLCSHLRREPRTESSTLCSSRVELLSRPPEIPLQETAGRSWPVTTALSGGVKHFSGMWHLAVIHTQVPGCPQGGEMLSQFCAYFDAIGKHSALCLFKFVTLVPGERGNPRHVALWSPLIPPHFSMYFSVIKDILIQPETIWSNCAFCFVFHFPLYSAFIIYFFIVLCIFWHLVRTNPGFIKLVILNTNIMYFKSGDFYNSEKSQYLLN